MRLLVVEDDPKIASFVAGGLRQAGHVVDAAHRGDDALALATAPAPAPYDAIVLDLMLPGLDGFTVIAELRRRRVLTPVLMLSALASVDDRVRGLEAGGDDYLGKPFSFNELHARLQALTRRAAGAPAAEPTRYAFADLSLDRLSRRVQRGEEVIELQPKEFALLEYLLRHAGRVVTKTMILQQVWDWSFDPGTNVVDVLVFRLRNKVDRDRQPRLIHTLRGVGYALRLD